MTTPLLSVRQLSRTVTPPVDLRTVRAWSDAGLITTYRVSGRRAFPPEAIHQLAVIVERKRQAESAAVEAAA